MLCVVNPLDSLALSLFMWLLAPVYCNSFFVGFLSFFHRVSPFVLFPLPMEYTGNTWRWRRNDRSEFLFILHRVTVLSAGSREQEQHKRIPRFRNRPSIRESFLSRETMFVVLNDKRGGEREYSSFVRNVYARRVIEFEMNGTKMKENRDNFWRKLIRYLKHW